MFATWVYGKLTESHKAIFSRDPLPHHFPIKLIYRQLVFSHIKPIGNELLLQSHTEYGLITLFGKKMRVFAIFLVVLLSAGCSLYVPGQHPLLIVPDGFKGEVMLVGDKSGGVQWTGAPLVIPASGALRVSNLEALAAIRPDAFDARYASGLRLQNRNRGGDWDVVGLWPIMVMSDDHETSLVYFVVGTFDSKTDFENYRMKQDWRPTLDRIRSGKEPNFEGSAAPERAAGPRLNKPGND